MWLAALLLAVAADEPSWPPAFSVEETTFVADRTSGPRSMRASVSAKVFVDGSRSRREWRLDGQRPLVFLFDAAIGRRIALDDGGRAYRETALEPSGPFPPVLAPERWMSVTRRRPGRPVIEHLSRELIEGQECDHSRARYPPVPPSNVFPAIGASVDDLWTSVATALPVRLVMVYGATGEYKDTVEWRNLRIEPQPASLFEVPEGYARSPDLFFAGADQEGRVLKAVDDEVRPMRPIDRAICNPPPLINVEGAGNRVFRSVGRLRASQTCLVGPEVEFEGWRVLPVSPPKGDATDELPLCDPDLGARVSSRRGRALSGCWSVGTFGERGRVAAVEFEGMPRLAAIVADIEGALVFEDLEGNTVDRGSVWRVDDGGVLQHDGFGLLFALEQEWTGALRLGVEWWGGEGADLSVLQPEGDRFLTPVTGYRYNGGH